MSQRLILEVVEGPLKGEAYAVSANRTLLIGRLPECDLAIPQDLTVSRQHFRVEFQPPDCRLVHLSQTGETLVNNIPVATANLYGGDCITFGAGNTVRVRIEDRPTAAVGEITNVAVPVRSAGTPPRETANPRDSFTMSATSSGWNVFKSAEPPVDFGKLLAILNQSQQIFGLIDYRRAAKPLPQSVMQSQFLFPWISPETQPPISPILVSPSTDPNLVETLTDGWGKDCIVCFGSSLTDADLLAHWQKAVGVQGDQPGTSMTVYFWPSLLKLMMTCQPADKLAPLLSGLTWLFFEDPESPGNWNLFANEQFSSVLTSAGLSLASNADSASQKKSS